MEALAANVYSAAEVARLSGLTPSRVQRWLTGYGYQTRAGEQRHSAALIHRPSDDGAGEASFADLIEIIFVQTFLKHGVKMRKIRRAAETAKEMFHSPHPFSLKKFETDGETVFLRYGGDHPGHTLDLARRQHAFGSVVRSYFKQLDYEDDIVARWWPMGRRGRVVIDPRRAFGQPIDAETAVPTRVLYQAVMADQSHAEVARWFEVPIAAVNAAVRFETRH